MSSPDDLLDEILAAAVAAGGSSGATLEELWIAAQDAEPELAWQPGRRRRMADALARLARAGTVTYSLRASAVDRAGDPPLPRRARPVTVVPKPGRPPRPVMSDAWRPELAGARDLERLRPDEIHVLNALNEWLREVADDEPVRPLRERSWQIFGDEKRLDSVARQRLFREGVLTLELLRAIQVHPPFVYERVADHGAAFICENHQTFHSAAQVLRSDPRGFAVVAYGAGRQFQAAVSYVEDLKVTGSVVYFGDLDADGLAIAGAAAVEAVAFGLPPVVPATGMYELLLSEPRAARTRPVPERTALELVEWLAPGQRDRAAAMLVAGRRVPQEATGSVGLARALRCW